ncbi:MAG: hypothetical protein SFU56_05990, partial [Capsulimonadales bacterium]|nr:hypothetical protein [Capsulimonadales bacterium]
MKRVLSLCTICWFLFLCGCQQTSNSQNPSVSVQPSVPSEEEHQNAKPYNQDALLLRSDYERLSAIGKSIYQTGTISDEDTDFWVAVVKKGPVVKETDVTERNLNQLGFESIAFGLIVGKKKLSPEQKKKLFDVVLPFTGDRRIDLPDDVEPT